MNAFFENGGEGRRPVRLAILTAALGVIGCFGAAFTFADAEPKTVGMPLVAMAE